jgi:hypothetical protein
MEWSVEVTDEFEEWWNGLSESEQVDVNAKVILLQRFGPALRRPIPARSLFPGIRI